MRRPLRPRFTLATALVLLPLMVGAGQSAATLYALNCMGCHLPPEGTKKQVLPLGGQFAHSETGRVFFINVRADGQRPLTAQENARLLDEILTWKRSCSVILQQAPLVSYGERKSAK